MSEMQLSELFLAHAEVNSTNIILSTCHPSLRGEKLSKWTAPFGAIVYVASSPLDVDFILAPSRKKKNSLPSSDVLVEDDNGDDNDASEEYEGLGRLSIFRIPRAARSEANLLSEADNAVSLVVVHKGRRTDILVLLSGIEGENNCTNIALLENCDVSGSPKKPRSKLTRLCCVAAPTIPQPMPLIISLAFLPGQFTHGFAVSEDSTLYHFSLLYVKKSKNNPEARNISLVRCGSSANIMGKVNHLFLHPTGLYFATSTGIFNLKNMKDPELHAPVLLFANPSLFVGVTSECILANGQLCSLSRGECLIQAPKGEGYTNSSFCKSTSACLAPSFGIVGKSIVIGDGTHIRIVSKSSGLKSLLEVGTIFLEAYGYFSINGLKDIKLPDSLCRMKKVVDWFQKYELDTNAYHALIGIPSAAGSCSTDGCLTVQSRSSIILQFKALCETYRRYGLLGIANRICTAAISEVYECIYNYIILFFSKFGIPRFN